MGVIGKDVSSTKRVYGQSFKSLAHALLTFTVPDRLAVYDPKDPTCARPETRERAKQRCSAYMASWASPAEDLTGLRIGIPQVYRRVTLTACIFVNKLATGVFPRCAVSDHPHTISASRPFPQVSWRFHHQCLTAKYRIRP